MALQKCDAEEFKDKLEQELVSNASNLSGGQKQRVALARAFIRKPQIMLLDDVTSALDVSTEQEILGNIYKYAKENNITTIITAQKVTSLSICDRVIVMQDGKIAEIGNNEELEKSSKIYKEIKELQLKVQ